MAIKSLSKLQWSIDQVCYGEDLSVFTPDDRIHPMLGEPCQFTKWNVEASGREHSIRESVPKISMLEFKDGSSGRAVWTCMHSETMHCRRPYYLLDFRGVASEQVPATVIGLSAGFHGQHPERIIMINLLLFGRDRWNWLRFTILEGSVT